jgi:hypothetical protein
MPTKKPSYSQISLGVKRSQLYRSSTSKWLSSDFFSTASKSTPQVGLLLEFKDSTLE